jgi:hypothetical protein
MSGYQEESVRTRAYELWEQAGSPEGQAEHFWYIAARELESVDRGVAASGELMADGPDQGLKEGQKSEKDEVDLSRAARSGREGGSR